MRPRRTIFRCACTAAPAPCPTPPLHRALSVRRTATPSARIGTHASTATGLEGRPTAFWKNTAFRLAPTADEPRRSIEPVWNAERKDRLEWHMADMVCSGQLDLHVAQEAIRANWVAANRTYIGEPR
jgi:hypothetical protein